MSFTALILLVLGLIGYSFYANESSLKERDLRHTLTDIAVASNAGRENTGTFPASLAEFVPVDQLWSTPYSKNPVKVEASQGFFPPTAAPGSILYKPLVAEDWMGTSETVKPGTVIGIHLMAYGPKGRQLYQLYTFPGMDGFGVIEKVRS